MILTESPFYQIQVTQFQRIFIRDRLCFPDYVILFHRLLILLQRLFLLFNPFNQSIPIFIIQNKFHFLFLGREGIERNSFHIEQTIHKAPSGSQRLYLLQRYGCFFLKKSVDKNQIPVFNIILLVIITNKRRHDRKYQIADKQKQQYSHDFHKGTLSVGIKQLEKSPNNKRTGITHQSLDQQDDKGTLTHSARHREVRFFHVVCTPL